jgi:ppGpp synthetase/RelA/SpoT-type nucleotidyltranferase
MALSRRSLKTRYEDEYQRYERARDKLVKTVESALEDMASAHGIRPIARLESSVKEFDSFYQKARDLEREGDVKSVDDCFEQIQDIARARVICQTVNDAERITRMLRELDAIFFYDTEVQTHAPAPETGYRAIHLNLGIDVQVGQRARETRCELQVVTALQYAWGLYTHSDFYKGKDIPPLVAALMRELSDLLNVADRFAGHLIDQVDKAPSTTRS